MKYVGNERAIDLVATLSYKDKKGKLKQIPVTQFFSANDPENVIQRWSYFLNGIGQETYFYILGGEENSEGKVNVQICFIGAKTGTQVKFERVFPLVDGNWWIS